MAEDRLNRGYAEALFAIAEAEGTLEDVGDELFRFARIMDRDARLREALTDPQLPAERKKSVIGELLTERANRHTVSLLHFLVDQGRARDLPKIANTVAAMAAGRYERAIAEVRTSVPLDEDRRRNLVDALKSVTGREVELKVIVDPSVIGGVLARGGDQVFDGTIRRKLELAREQLARR